MADEIGSGRSRRTILGAAAGGLAALAAQAVAGPLSVDAATGDPVLAGHTYTASASTGVTTTSGNGLQGYSSDAGASGVYGENTGTGYGVAGRTNHTSRSGVYGENYGSGPGVYGYSSGVGVAGLSSGGHGVSGSSPDGVGVYGESTSNGMAMYAFAEFGGPAVLAWNVHGQNAIIGHVGGTTAIPASTPSETAIFGYATTTDGAGRGVAGESPTGHGVHGVSSGGVGVYGTSSSGHGVEGFSANGEGVHGSSDAAAGVGGFSKTFAGVLGVGGPTGATQGVNGSNGSPKGYGVIGYSFERGAGIGTGVMGYANPGGAIPQSLPDTGLLGIANGGSTSIGVHGRAPNGRGGLFEGKAAQLRLVPSTASSHPTSGQLGDLFLDKNKRLWFCKGGTTWKQIA